MFTSNSYEISDEISRAKIQAIERKYGGRVRAHTAATKIQRAFRRFRLEQQFQNALRYPGPPGRRKPVQHHHHPMLPTDSSLNSFQLNGDRQLYTKKLALSQPTLRYQPAVSLRAQLRVEQGSFEDSSAQRSPPSTSIDYPQVHHNRSPPSPRPVEPMLSKVKAKKQDDFDSPRSYNSLLMSPRLIQRRTPISERPHSPYHHNTPPSSTNYHYGPVKIQPGKNPRMNVPLAPSTREEWIQYQQATNGGTVPVVWVPRDQPDVARNHRRKKENDEKYGAIPEPNNTRNARPKIAENGHVVASYSNSLPRLDRRNRSLGPHTSYSIANNNSPGFVGESHPPYHITMNPFDEREQRKEKRIYRICLNFFNKKPDRGIEYLIRFNFVENNPVAIATFILGRRGLSRQMIGEFVGTLHSEFHTAILEACLDRMNFYNLEIDVALQQMLKYFRFPGEAQKIDHIIQAFAKRFMYCNSNKYPGVDVDAVYIVSFGIIMLNTDLHTPQIKKSKRMSCDDFIKNLRGAKDTEVFSDTMLAQIYERVKENPFRTGPDHVTQVQRVDSSLVGKNKPPLVEPHRRLICYCRLNQVLDVNRKQSAADHNRELFLFNDLLIIAKNAKKKTAQYSLRYWSPLIGVKIDSYETPLFRNVIHFQCPDNSEFIFNAKNDDDRIRFYNDVVETVLEATQMEQYRIEWELDKQASVSQRELIGHRLAHNQEVVPKTWDSSCKYFDSFFDSEIDNGAQITNLNDPLFPSDSITPTPSVSAGKLSHNGVSTSSGCSVSNASTASASSNSTPAPPNRRLSFNSLDSGMAEES